MLPRALVLASLALAALLTATACTGAGSNASPPGTAPPAPPASGVGGVQAVSEGDFDQILATTEAPVLVDFWAPWCGPCRALGPNVEAVAAEMGARLRVLKLNIDDAATLSRRYDASSIPLLIVFKHGKPVARSLGYLPVDAVRKFVIDAGA